MSINANLLGMLKLPGIEAPLTVVLCWLMASDGEIAKEEFVYLTEVPDALKDKDTLQAIVTSIHNGEIECLEMACRSLDRQLNAKGKILILELVIGMILADNKVSLSELYILDFMADLFHLTHAAKRELFRKTAGAELRNYGDPSSAKWWEELERRARTENSEEASRQKHTASCVNEMTKAEALKCLGLPENATKTDIQRTFRNLAKQYHPDRFGPLGKDAVQAAHVIFLRIHSAYNFLMAL